jgi:hypothetical protein
MDASLLYESTQIWVNSNIEALNLVSNGTTCFEEKKLLIFLHLK